MIELKAVRRNQWITSCLAALFGMAPLVGFGSLLVEGPLVTRQAPEGWRLGSQSSTISHFSFVAPILYTLYQKYAQRKIADNTAITALLSVGIATLVFAIFTLESTIFIDGAERSIPYFVISFVFSLMNSLGSVLFLPYMGRFLENYMLVFMFGESLGGFLPAIISLFQGSGGDSQCILTNTTEGKQEWVKYNPPPNFSIQIFLMFSTGLLTIGLVSFLLLDSLRVCKTEYAKVVIAPGNCYTYQNDQKDYTNKGACIVSQRTYWTLLLLNGLSSVTQTLSGSVSSYVYLPYGQEIYHLQASIALALNPITSAVSLFLRTKRLYIVIPLYVLSLVIAGYTLLLAGMSPNPPLAGTKIGGIIIITIRVLKLGIGAYIRMSTGPILRATGGRSLVCIGVFNQLGGTVGTLSAFLMVNTFQLFTAIPTNCE